MKNVLKRIATVASVMALIVVTSICMTACGGNDNTPEDPQVSLDQIQGLYGNLETKEVYYFNGDDCYRTYISINETKEDGWQNIKYDSSSAINEHYKISVSDSGTYFNRKHAYSSENKKPWEFISPEGCKDLPENFTVTMLTNSGFETTTYSKFSSLVEFAQEAFPFDAGYKIDPDDTSALSGVWKDLYTVAA